MAVKEWFRRLQPVQLYLVLFFTTTFFLIEIIASHLTHSLTLLLNAYHMLCNIVALVGCIASIKVNTKIRKPFLSLTYEMTMIIAIEKGTETIVTAVQWEIHPFALTEKNRVLSHLYRRKQRNVNSQDTKDGEQQLSAKTRRSPLAIPKSQGFREMCRDVLGCVFVILVSILVYFTDSDVAKFIDPVFAIISSISLFVLCYPYMKESGLILLQTIPNHINIDSLKRELLEAFPGIVNVHDLHVWQLAGEKIISTAHIIFLDPTVYASITDQVTAFFVEMGITQVTIQPEFHKMKPNMEKTDCLIRCHGEHCSSSQCCSRENFLEDACKSEKETHTISRKYDKKEIIPATCAISLEKFTTYVEETLVRTAECDPRAEKSEHESTNENTSRLNDDQV
ncbi:zinc transporter 1 [Lasius niger]|uniref:Zinc transporter 1 n=1 Tax=Lasius niger TaxID=67767 RepID=A0A0J7L002_LASNI|nr:zinc transporter 1 [Lasius niger]